MRERGIDVVKMKSEVAGEEDVTSYRKRRNLGRTFLLQDYSRVVSAAVTWSLGHVPGGHGD